MPKGMHNSTMAEATGLIFLLFDVASAQESVSRKFKLAFEVNVNGLV